jgi:ketosteroid isomerase-like protein
MRMKKWFFAMVVLLTALAGCQASPTPEEVLAEMAAALNAGDVNAAMACFADDAVVKLVPALPPGSPDTYSGAEAIGAWFESLVAGNFEIDVEVLDVDGDTVTTRTSTWMDATREMGVAPLVATETYTIRDGKIRGFTWAISEESMASVQAAMAPPSPQEVLAEMAAALNRGDVDAAVAFFTEDAVVKLVPALPPGSPDTYSGAEEIRGWFEELVAGNFEIDVEVLDVEGDTVTTRTSTWMDATREMGVAPLVGTETYTIRDGKIRGFTWAISDESMAKVQAALATPTPSPPPPTATPEPTLTPELIKATVTDLEYLVGVWEGSNQGALQFDADGTMLVSESLAGLSSGQASRGECWFDGSLLTFADADGSGEGSYAVELRITVEGDPVSLKLRAVEDPFVDRREILTKRVWIWVEP